QGQLGVVRLQRLTHRLCDDLQPPGDDVARGLDELAAGAGGAGEMPGGIHGRTVRRAAGYGKTSAEKSATSFSKAGAAASMISRPFSGLACSGSDPIRPSGKRAR